MAQVLSKPMPTKPLIDATVPGTPNSPVKNISDVDKKKIIEGWNKKAAERVELVARECAAPISPTRILKFELQQFGRYWQAIIIDGRRRSPLLGAPSLLSSALDALEDAMLQRANRA